MERVKELFEQIIADKTCPICGKSHDRRSDFCSEKCHQKYYYEKNKEKLLEKHKKWIEENREKHNSYSKRWHEKHKNYNKQWHKINKDYNKEYYEKNKINKVNKNV